MPKLTPAAFARRARAIELVVLDVDGTLTDGGLYYGPEGEAFKRFDVKDGHGIVLARLVGLRTAILTARRSAIVATRGQELGIAPIVQGAKDKREGFHALLAEVGLEASKVCYVGDDVNDLGPLLESGLRACPGDAHPEVRRVCHFVAKAGGGRGAVRELYEALLRARGQWDAVMARMVGKA